MTTKKAGSSKSGSQKKTSASKKSMKPEVLYEKLRDLYGGIDGVPLGDPVDMVVFAHLALHMELPDAAKAFTAFKANFVDWNEVRIASEADVRDVVKKAPDADRTAAVIREFLIRLFDQAHHLGLEFMREKSISEIRGFFKKTNGFADSVIQLLLHEFREYPVVPIESWMQPFLQRVGLLNGDATTLQQQKDLYQISPQDRVFENFILLAQHAQFVCLAEDGTMDCPNCVLKRSCPHPDKTTARTRKKPQ